MLVDLKEFGVDDGFLAHTPSETLKEHSNLTNLYFGKLSKAKNLDTIINNLILSIDKDNFEFIKSLFLNAIFLHDIGKINPNFQAKKMNNDKFKEYKNSTESSNHSFYSAKLYIEYFTQKIDEIKNKKIKVKLQFIIYSFAYQISKHHGKISTFEEFCKDEVVVKSYWHHLSKLSIPSFEFYILNKLLFSLLVSSDYYATTEYMSNIEFNGFGTILENKKNILKYRFDNYLKGFGIPEGINELRNEILKEAKSNLLKNLDKNIFYLEAPTGSGKTLTSISLALELLNSIKSLNKIFYIFPFNTLVEQTKQVFEDVFDNDLDIEVINSISSIELKNDDAIEDKETLYNNSYISRLFFHHEVVLTTHIQLFNILFGISKNDNFPLWQLANSVIIIDEIQSYNNHLWWYMVEFFEKYAKYLNIKIIIMSATLPKLDYFLEQKDSFIDLVSKDRRDYFFNSSYFRNRVQMDFSLLDNKIDFYQLVEILKKETSCYQKILFEFISKKSAIEFFNIIKYDFDNVYELSGDDNKAHRQYIINETKKNQNIIVVATQVIEAGVDIDMDLGFKDISTIDSEEQFMGRINRSCKKNSINPKVYFFDFDDASKMYVNDNRLGYDLTQEFYRDILKTKDFNSYYKNVLEDIQKDKNRFKDGLMTDYNSFESNVQRLNYKNISKTMTLIHSETFTLYFPFMLDISLYKGIKEFENLDNKFLSDGLLDGQKVWDEFIKLNDIENFIEKEIKKSKINSLIQFFTFNIFKYFDGQRPYIGEELYGYYFVENYEEFITDDCKFDRDKYNQEKESIFL
jgi:CRISPR-associated endonuclease/helicase Cas3